MATKTAEAAAVVAPAKSKKLLLIVLAAVLFVVLAGLGTVLYVNKQRAAAELGDEEARPVAGKAEVGPPTYLPLDNMVVNLADPGGERVAQIGITLELQNAAAVEQVKQYLPTIRSGILLLVSQRASEDLLKIEGKEKLARDILREASKPFGGIDEDDVEADAPKNGENARSTRKQRRAPANQPVQRVLFSSFIVQ